MNTLECRLACAAILMIIATGAAQAQDWQFTPVLRAGGEFDDNAELSTRTDDEVQLNGYLLEAEATLEYTSPATNFFITPRLRSARYSGEPEFDLDDQFARGEFNYETQSNTFNVRLRYSRQSVRTAEIGEADLEVDDPDDITDDDTGLVNLQDRRQKFSIRPSWQYRLSDISSIIAQFDFQKVDYDDSLVLGGLTDYTDTRVRLSYERRLSDRNMGVFSATYRNYDAQNFLDDTAGIGLQVGLIRDITSSSRLRALVGVEETERALGENDQRFVYDFSLTQRLQTITLVAQYKRNVNASGVGRLTARDSFNIRFTRQLNEKLSAGLGVRAYQTNALNDFNFNERDYVQLRSRFTWSLTPKFSLEADYRYTFLRRAIIGESANSNNVMLWFMYSPVPDYN